jgi:1-acyl-sn-glycerol-3-phosphate acyltransferase
MKVVLSYILSVLFYLAFFILLVLFHPVQVICYNLFGSTSHKKSVDVLNFCLMRLVGILGVRITYETDIELPTDRPLIVVSNHQGTYDIPPIVWIFRKHFPKFISKIELGKNIPSVSYNLRKSGAALIDRKNRNQALPEIQRLGKLISDNNYTACIFPEGTRSKTGKMRRFKSGGIDALLKAAPNALIVPFVVDGNYRLETKGMFPLNIGQYVKYSILNPIEPKGKSAEEITQEAELMIREKLNQ